VESTFSFSTFKIRDERKEKKHDAYTLTVFNQIPSRRIISVHCSRVEMHLSAISSLLSHINLKKKSSVGFILAVVEQSCTSCN
jgi:hypothetical protein